MPILYIYYGFVLACFAVSLFAGKYTRGFQLLPLIMGLTVVTECLAALVAIGFDSKPFFIYHFNLPIEYSLFGLFFFYLEENKKVKKAILWSIGFYILTSGLCSIFFYSLNDFPGLMMNLTGILLITLSLYQLLTLEVIDNLPIYKHPMLWICVGIIVFYSGTFFFNGLYNYLRESKNINTALVHNIINNGLNCFMYTCFIVGLACSHNLKKRLSQPQSIK